MKLGYNISDDVKGKRLFWIGPPALCDLSLALARQGALRALRPKWQTTLKMLQAHTPEFIVLYFRHAHEALGHEQVIALEDLLQVNIQLVDSIDAFENPAYVKSTGAFSPTVYVWAASAPPLALMQEGDDGWVRFIDDGDLLADYPSITVGMLLMEDALTSTLVLSKHLQNMMAPSRRIVPKPKVILALGKLSETEEDRLRTIICELAKANKVASIIATDDSMEMAEYAQDMANHVRVINIADELDPFSVSLIWKNVKAQRSGMCTCIFLGQWSFDARRNPTKTLAEFQKLEKETKMAAVYDVWSWWSLHPGVTPAEDMSVTANPVFLLQSFLKGGDDASLTLEAMNPNDPEGGPSSGGSGDSGGGGCGKCCGDDDGEPMECVQQ